MTGKPSEVNGRSSAKAWPMFVGMLPRQLEAVKGGSPLYADLPQFKGCLGKKKNKKDTGTPLRLVYIHNVCYHGDSVWVEYALHWA